MADKKPKAVSTANVVGSPVTTLAGLGLGALNLFANGTSAKQIGISTGAAFLMALLQDPSMFSRKK